MIVSHELSSMKARELDLEFEDVDIVLCTLSMLSNLNLRKVFRKVRMNNLVVDEASQISVFDYMVRRELLRLRL